uniref:(northern house mosquito) hypothetical protein n=1 Tax=Culex pipiens TaxID=7175 RepID=A0A8D8D749_CULPI
MRIVCHAKQKKIHRRRVNFNNNLKRSPILPQKLNYSNTHTQAFCFHLSFEQRAVDRIHVGTQFKLKINPTKRHRRNKKQRLHEFHVKLLCRANFSFLEAKSKHASTKTPFFHTLTHVSKRTIVHSHTHTYAHTCKNQVTL